MKHFFTGLFTFLLAALVCKAQYAPQVSLPGSTAISGSNSVFVGWATGCAVQRGFMNIADTSLGYATAGDSSLAIGTADDYTVSLGDSGVAVLTFASPIYDGPGPDFAVFENGFTNPANDSQAFLELGFVEVSSDGINYVRFPAMSLTQDSVQVANGNYLYANNLNNLAGKYLALYGTPFDLQELADSSKVDISNITHVRVVDVIGSIHGHSSYDIAGRIINDPYPTPFPTCGFDLDAVGVINQVGKAEVHLLPDNSYIKTYPNPTNDNIYISVKQNAPANLNVAITDITGNILQRQTLQQSTNILHTENYAAGIYYLIFDDTNGNKWVEKVVKF